MPINGEGISNVLTRTINALDNKRKRLVVTTNPKIAIVITAITLIISLSLVINSENIAVINNAYAQIPLAQQHKDTSNLQDKITIQLDSVRFAPLTDSNSSQLKIVVNYQTNDQSMVNTPMKGTMKVYLPDGTPLKTSSIQKGYIVGQTGIIQFASSFTDKTIQNVKADVYLTDTQGAEKISNILTIETSVEK